MWLAVGPWQQPVLAASSLGEASGRKPEGNGIGLGPRGRKGGTERDPVSSVPPLLMEGKEQVSKGQY